GVERRSEKSHQGVVGCFGGTWPCRGRHGAGLQLADNLLPRHAVLRRRGNVQRAQRELARSQLFVVAAIAVLAEHCLMGCRRGRRLLCPAPHAVPYNKDRVREHHEERQPAFHRTAFHRTTCSGGSASSGIMLGQKPGQGISFAPSFRSSTAVCGCAANELPYSAPSATDSGVRPLLSITSRFAPRSNRYCT